MTTSCAGLNASDLVYAETFKIDCHISNGVYTTLNCRLCYVLKSRHHGNCNIISCYITQVAFARTYTFLIIV